MKPGKWYSIHYESPILVISFGIANRLISGSCFSFILVLAISYGRELFEPVHPVQLGVVLFIFGFLGLMTLQMDEYRFDLGKRTLVIKKGVFPFHKTKIGSLNDIAEVKITKIESVYGKDRLYEVSLFLKDNVKKLGVFADVSLIRSTLGEFVTER